MSSERGHQLPNVLQVLAVRVQFKLLFVRFNTIDITSNIRVNCPAVQKHFRKIMRQSRPLLRVLPQYHRLIVDPNRLLYLRNLRHLPPFQRQRQ